MTIDTQDLIDAVQASLPPDLLSPQERARYTWLILDPTREQYTAHGEQPPYYLGKGRGFQGRRCARTGLQLPTKRARVLIDRAVVWLS